MAKRILVVVRTLRIGGMERVAVNLCDAFAELGHEVHLLSMKHSREELGPELDTVVMHQVDFDRINRLTIIGLFYDFVSRVINLFYRKSTFLWRGLYTAFYFSLWLRRTEKRYGKFDLIIVRGQGTFEYLWPLRDPRMLIFAENIIRESSPIARRRIFAKALYEGKRIACVSSGVRQSVAETLGRFQLHPASLEVFSNPCPISRIRELSLQTDDDIPQEPYIVNVSRLVPQKNHRLLIDAYARSGVKERLVIVGGGSEEGRLRAQVRDMGLDERVYFAGSRSNPYPWMKGAQLFVLTSSIEGFGVVLVESMACGTPVVAVDCPGGIRDVLIDEQVEFLVPEDVDAVADKIRFALKHPLAIQEHWVGRFEARSIARSIVESRAQ